MVINNHATVLSQIYDADTAISCYCNPCGWALSNAAQLFAKQNLGDVLRYQGSIDDDLYNNIEQLLRGAPHASLIFDHIKTMLEMFEALLEPEEIGLRILACDYARSPNFHQPHTVVRMMSTLGGEGERWIEPGYITYLPLEHGQLTPQIKDPEPHHINALCNGDIALIKGLNWLEQEHNTLYFSSPEFHTQQAKLCVYIDYLK